MSLEETENLRVCEPSQAPSTQSSESSKAAGSKIGYLYQRHSRAVVTALRTIFGNGPPDPEDVTQLAFQKLLEYPHPNRIRNPEAFLWRTARNLVFNDKRSQNVRIRYEYEVEQLYFTNTSDNIAAERVVSARVQLSTINEALLAMPERRRRAFVLHRVEKLTVSEVARRLGVSRTAAVKHLQRAFADIDELLQGEE